MAKTDLKIISVDPGLQGTGWATWSLEHWTQCVLPIKWGILTPQDERGHMWVSRCQDLATKLESIIATHAVTECYCEFPMRFDSALGNAASAGQISDIGKLTFLCGVFARMCKENDCDFIPVPVNEWKGQLSKEAVETRIMRKLEVDRGHFSSHACDAVGIGLHQKGFLHAVID